MGVRSFTNQYISNIQGRVSKLYNLFSAILLLCFISLPAEASIYRVQSPLNNGDGYLSVGPAGAQTAEKFQTFQSVMINTIEWWGSYDSISPSLESFTVRIFKDDGTGNPGSQALYEKIFQGLGDNSEQLIDLFGVPVFRYELLIPDWHLLNNQSYFLSIFSNDASHNWYWLETENPIDNKTWHRSFDSDLWRIDGASFDMSYLIRAQFVTNISEPSTLFLLLLPLLYLSWGKFFNLRKPLKIHISS